MRCLFGYRLKTGDLSWKCGSVNPSRDVVAKLFRFRQNIFVSVFSSRLEFLLVAQPIDRRPSRSCWSTSICSTHETSAIVDTGCSWKSYRNQLNSILDLSWILSVSTRSVCVRFSRAKEGNRNWQVVKFRQKFDSRQFSPDFFFLPLITKTIFGGGIGEEIFAVIVKKDRSCRIIHASRR